jgi:restriction system protein
MAIPNYQELMLPVLQTLNKKGGLKTTECADNVANLLGLNDQEIAELLPSGKQRTIHNRTGWAAWYMMQAGLISRPKRGWIEITEEGRKLLEENPDHIDRRTLMRYPSFVEKITKSSEDADFSQHESEGSGEKTPHEKIEAAVAELRTSLVADLRDLLTRVDPYRFEQVVIDLLLALGYGGSRKEAAQVTQKSGDEGIDGVINEDRLGLDVIYVQAKRWAGKVGRPQIQSFAGALAVKKSNKGIFITTGEFHDNALEYTRDVQHKIILIDGRRLAELMIDNNIGISDEYLYRVKKVDSDYFESSEL